MSINIRCKKCRGTNQLQAKVCKRCGESIGKERIYRIQVRVKGKWVVRQVGTLDEAKAVEVELKQQRTTTAATTISPQDITFKDVWQAFHQSIKTRICSAAKAKVGVVITAISASRPIILFMQSFLCISG